MEIAVLLAGRRPGALHKRGLEPTGSLAKAIGAALASEGKRLMSMPISAMMARALRALMPKTELTCSAATRKGARSASTCRSIAAMAASRASICPRCSRSRKRWFLVTRPRRASHSWAVEAFSRGSASWTSLAGLVSPAISASIIALPLLPMTSVITESSLMLASSNVFCMHWT